MQNKRIVFHSRESTERSVPGSAPGAGFGVLAETGFPSQMQKVRGSDPKRPKATSTVLFVSFDGKLADAFTKFRETDSNSSG